MNTKNKNSELCNSFDNTKIYPNSNNKNGLII